MPPYKVIIVKKTYQFTMPFKDDIRQIADVKQQISQTMTCAAHRLNVTVLRSNIIFCDICRFTSASWRISSLKAVVNC